MVCLIDRVGLWGKGGWFREKGDCNSETKSLGDAMETVTGATRYKIGLGELS